jgi:hypothetical protein
MKLAANLALAVACFGLPLSTTYGVAEALKQEVIGTWMLIANKSAGADGTKTDLFGPNPKGIATFDSKRRFSIVIMRADLPKIASNGRMTATADENKAVVQGSLAYFGSYSTDDADRSLIFHIEASSFPNWVGTTQKRSITTLSEDDLVLINGTASMGGVAEVQWKRVK